MTQEYTIQVKGNIPRIITESKIYKREYNDFSYGYGFIKFKGTERQLDKLLDHLTAEGDNDFKIIGVHDEETEEYYKQMFPEAYEKFKQSHKL